MLYGLKRAARPAAAAAAAAATASAASSGSSHHQQFISGKDGAKAAVDGTYQYNRQQHYHHDHHQYRLPSVTPLHLSRVNAEFQKWLGSQGSLSARALAVHGMSGAKKGEEQEEQQGSKGTAARGDKSEMRLLSSIVEDCVLGWNAPLRVSAIYDVLDVPLKVREAHTLALDDQVIRQRCFCDAVQQEHKRRQEERVFRGDGLLAPGSVLSGEDILAREGESEQQCHRHDEPECHEAASLLLGHLRMPDDAARCFVGKTFDGTHYVAPASFQFIATRVLPLLPSVATDARDCVGMPLLWHTALLEFLPRRLNAALCGYLRYLNCCCGGRLLRLTPLLRHGSQSDLLLADEEGAPSGEDTEEVARLLVCRHGALPPAPWELVQFVKGVRAHLKHEEKKRYAEDVMSTTGMELSTQFIAEASYKVKRRVRFHKW